ncbi:acetyl-CoA hydrolase/transferase family protein [Nocardioides campestrisoli]|uniref:acetyl-CoA hydrolase/transferase family protein n=1 Tax=Nocardioides campestrisoli TaxID=2736757 RepID=UPI00163DAB76|nr:acetyl-CoA hydrolase/transferase family protein [Nocardioides campestrisoli]
MLRTLPIEAAMDLLPPGARIVAAPGCGTPETLLTALADRADLLGSPTLYSGLQLGTYPFLAAAAEGHLRHVTWHPYGPARKALAPGQVEYVPARASAVPGLLDTWRTDAAFVRVSPPDRHGYCSLGPSASYVRHAVRRASVVLAEVDPLVPRTTGDSMLHVSQLDALVDATTPPCTFPSAVRDEQSDRVAAHILPLLPDRPVLQLGIGSVPESVTAALGDSGLRGVRIVGMANDAMVDLFDRGVLSVTDLDPAPAVLAAELMGTRLLMERAHDNPAIVLRESTVSHSPRSLGSLDRLVSINGAVEVDLLGQVNSEMVGPRQISGVGGSMDFVESGFASVGGLTVVAVAAAGPDGRHSRIVRRLGADVVTLPRHTVDVVVTEYGVADLRGLSEPERAEALVEIAHPDHRAALREPGHTHKEIA